MSEPNGAPPPRLIRRRYIPDETVELADDEIELVSDELIITRWKPIRPRSAGDFTAGVSAAYLKRGYKISALLSGGGVLRYYADIIAADYKPEENTYIFRDLLADVVVYPGGGCQILDLDELAEALSKGYITQEDCARALNSLHELLSAVYSGAFEVLCEPLLEYI